MFDSKIKELYKNDQIKTAKSYESSLKSFSLFVNPRNPEAVTNLHIIAITVDWLKSYENYMLSKENSYSTIGIYVRNLRAIVNIILENNAQFKKYYPFGNGKLYQIPSTKKPKSFKEREYKNSLQLRPYK